MNTLRYVGLDVHKDSIVMSVADSGAADAKVLAKLPNDTVKLLKQLRKLSPDISMLRVCYEAGPTGYGLCRRLRKDGINCIVVAPSLVPQMSGLRIKTDRRDSKKLAHFLRSGDLTEVWVPDEQTEALRDLERARDDAKNAERRARHQLSKLLLRNDRIYRDGKEWTVKHMRWIRQQKFEDACRQCVLEDNIKAVDDATVRVKDLMKNIEKFVEGHALRPLVKALMAFRGIDTLSATVIAAEIGDLRRFRTASQFMAFLGLVPSERSSGGSVKRGSLTKTGNGHARRILVEAAQHYRHRPVHSKALRKRQMGVSPEVIEISWAAQQRLCSRLTHFTNSGKPRNKAIVALARELAGFIWSVGQLPELLT
ncbi:MAG: IS110 family transposase [Planctomyces sp.]|nr:IS110 family transposase [Planctomyces sp.]